MADLGVESSVYCILKAFLTSLLLSRSVCALAREVEYGALRGMGRKKTLL